MTAGEILRSPRRRDRSALQMFATGAVVIDLTAAAVGWNVIAAADLDRDGSQDLAVASTGSSIMQVLYNRTSGWTASAQIPVAASPRGIDIRGSRSRRPIGDRRRRTCGIAGDGDHARRQRHALDQPTSPPGPVRATWPSPTSTTTAAWTSRPRTNSARARASFTIRPSSRAPASPSTRSRRR